MIEQATSLLAFGLGALCLLRSGQQGSDLVQGGFAPAQ